MSRVYTRAEWGARVPARPYGHRPDNHRLIVHWSGSKITPAGVNAGAQERKPPKRPGAKWYRLWRDPKTPAAQRRKLSKQIAQYNRLLRAFKAYERAQVSVDPKVVALEQQIMRQFQAYHMDGHGWSDLGYHEVIFASGNVYLARPPSAWGAHCLNANERLGFCLVMTEGDRPTHQMISSYEDRVEYHSIKDAWGHRQIPGNSTACPGRLISDLGLPAYFN
jgi:N-acetylmuramoyl-L-alanine amidase